MIYKFSSTQYGEYNKNTLNRHFYALDEHFQRTCQNICSDIGSDFHLRCREGVVWWNYTAGSSNVSMAWVEHKIQMKDVSLRSTFDLPLKLNSKRTIGL